jgi:hypothetical protein
MKPSLQHAALDVIPAAANRINPFGIFRDDSRGVLVERKMKPSPQRAALAVIPAVAKRRAGTHFSACKER